MLRTLLFAPANVTRRVDKALGLNADAIILDLEDSVPIAEKSMARTLVAEALQKPRKGLAYVRVNALTTMMTIDDINAVVCPELDGIMLTKVEEPVDLQKADWLIEHLEEKQSMSAGSFDLIPLVENAKGVHNAYEIARAVPRVKRLCFGAVDYSADIGVELTEQGSELFYARSHLVNASRAAGLEPPIDTVYPDVKNPEGFKKDVQIAVNLGFQGKLVLHPDQVEEANKSFSPSEEEIEYAKNVIAAFEKAEAQGHAAITMDNGKFIDYPVVNRARRVLELAKKIAHKDERQT